MNLKKVARLFAKLLIAVMIFTALAYFCNKQTKGFRPYLILSDLPNDSRWEVPPLNLEEQKQIDTLLDQSFTYLGSGGWCYAFLGQDKKTVLKFYRHTHLLLPSIMQEFSLQKLLLKSPRLSPGTSYFQEFNFKSCILLYTQAKERTGLQYVHLNKTEGLHKPVTLFDNIGVKHIIDLDKTEFVVQKKADLLLPHIDRLVAEKNMTQAKQCIDDIIECLLTFYKLGARDYDSSLRNNFGYIEEGAVSLDLSSFGIDETLKKPGEYRKELVIKTRELSRFLRKNHEPLHHYLEERLSEIVEKG